MKFKYFKKELLQFGLIALLLIVAACRPESDGMPIDHEFVIGNITLGQRVSRVIEIPADHYAVIRVQGHGTEVVASIQDPAAGQPQTVSLSYFRLHPLFLKIQAAHEAQKLELHLDPVRTTRSGSISIQISFLSTDSAADKRQFEAYSLIAAALTTEQRPIKAREDNLEKAARLLRANGQIRDAQWADFFRAYLVYMYPFDLARSLEIIEQVVKVSEKRSFSQLHLASMQLLGAILVERGKDAPAIAARKFRRGQQVLVDVQSMAQSMGMPYESAWALNNSGIGFYYQKNYAQALQQYDKAIEITQAVGDLKVSKLVLSNRALAAEKSGRYFEALESLKRMGEFLELADEPSLLASNYRNLGRINRIIANYKDAITHLTVALELFHNLGDVAGEGRVLVSLGIAHLQMGREKVAEAEIELGLQKLNDKGSGTDIRDAIKLLADVKRLSGDFSQASELRGQQSRFLSSGLDEAELEYGTALDRLAEGRPDRAVGHLEACVAKLAQDKPGSLLKLCQLKIFRINAEQHPDKVDIELVRAVALELARSPRIEQALSSQQLLAEIEFFLGNHEQSLVVARNLVEKLALYRKALPGVMGAWYWQSRKNILEFYFERTLQSNEQKRDGPLANFLAFMSLQNLGARSSSNKDPVFDGSADASRTWKLRELIAKRVGLADLDESLLLQTHIDQLLITTREQADYNPRSVDELSRLIAEIPDDAGIITYYFGRFGVYAWLVGSKGVQQFDLHSDEALIAAISEARNNFRLVGAGDRLSELLDDIGASLLGDLEADLPAKTYFLTTGPLSGFPVDALRLNGRFLSATHDVIQILNFEQVIGHLKDRNEPTGPLQVLLAGSPIVSGSGTNILPGSSKEIRQIAEILEHANVTRLEGNAFKLAAILPLLSQSPDIIHFASHATLDLDYPELSKILLSSGSGDIAAKETPKQYLMPADINRLDLPGSLVVLSACETSGSQQFSFDSNLGFVTAFMNGGAERVIASLWPVGDQSAAEFMVGFYQRLNKGTPPEQALLATKRDLIKQGGVENISQWAAFQLYKN